jgi:tetratricopeptide (TPR) repeat protein
MKKTFILLAMVFVILTVQSQKLNVQSAYSSLSKGYYDKALKYIEPAITDLTTKDWAKTWMYRGDIYLGILLSKDDKYSKLDSNALQKAYDSYQKAIELDTKKEYYQDMMLKLFVCGEQYYNKGVTLYTAQKYEDAMNSFDKTASINATFKIADSLATYNAAICAEYANKNDKAIEYYKNLIKIDYQKAAIYSNLANIYRKKFLEDNPYKNVDIGTDTATVITLLGKPDKVGKTKINNSDYDEWKYSSKLSMLFEYGKVTYYNTDSVVPNSKSFDDGIKAIQKGLKAFPDDNTIIISEANLYLTAGKFSEAKAALEKLKEKDPTNPTVYYAIGNAYFDQYNNESNSLEIRTNAYDEAVKTLSKAIELKADYFDAIYMLGAIYFNEGIRIEQEAENYATDMKKYTPLKEKFDLLYKSATDNLEKASLLKADDWNTLIALKKLYSRLNMTDKYKEVNDKLNKLK